jgi:hypothetical protein
LDYVGSVTAWRGNEPIVISGSSDGTIKAWNTQTGALIATGEGHTRDAWAVAVTHGPKPLIVSGSFDRTVRVWDLNPIIEDLNWERRKWYMLFLSGLWKFNSLPMIHIDPWGEVKILPPHGAPGGCNSSFASAATTPPTPATTSSSNGVHFQREDDESISVDEMMDENDSGAMEQVDEDPDECYEKNNALCDLHNGEEAYHVEENRIWTSSKASLRALFGSHRPTEIAESALKKSLFSNTSYSLVEKKKKNKKLKPVFNRDDWNAEVRSSFDLVFFVLLMEWYGL